MEQPARLDSTLDGADVVLVVPPFAWIDRPALGVHLLQAVGRREGRAIRVVYANVLFAAAFSEATHHTLSRIGHGMFLAERVFARAAYGTPALGRDAGSALEPTLAELAERYGRAGLPFNLTVRALQELEARIAPWVAAIAASLARVPVVGISTSFEQNAAAIAIARAVKRVSPTTVTLLGGANCEGAMAAGVLTLSDAVDHVFSGESEVTFARFLRERGGDRIIEGAPAEALDELPTPDYADYYAHLAAHLGDSPVHTRGFTCLSYETSRGCWWGQKSHCTFCGLNGQGMAFRAKSADRVIEELRALLAAHPAAERVAGVAAGGTLQGHRERPTKLVTLTDNIMPHTFFRTLLPRLEREMPDVTLMYEQKANLTLAQCQALVRAGITEIQPGIEALSTGLLRLMAKGTTAAQNIALLRYAHVTGLYLYWNLLYGFPNDVWDHYRETLELAPLLAHLQPPVSMCQVIFDRFSPYFDHAARYGITGLRPAPYYAAVLPDHAALDQIAYHFEGDCATALRDRPQLAAELGDAVTRWRQAFHRDRPAQLSIRRLDDARFELVDTRGLPGVPEHQILDEAQAAMALVTRPIRARQREAYAWALAAQVVVERDGKYVALAVAGAELLALLESRYRRDSDGLLGLAATP